MTKEEVIKRAWEEIGVTMLVGICMDTGYSQPRFVMKDVSEISDFHKLPKEDFEFSPTGRTSVKYRPKALEGIENNNGWTKIESPADVPKEFGLWHITTKGNGKSSFTGRLSEWGDRLTHYQPIEIPKDAIY